MEEKPFWAQGLVCPLCGEGAEEDTSSRSLVSPVRPTQQMIDDHEVSHTPFRSWCPFCVRGRGQSAGHFEVDKGDEQLPTISVDYGFLGTPDSPADELPVLLVKDRKSKATWSHPVPNKGLRPSDHGAKMLQRDIVECGYRRLILKSDQEPSIRALCNAVQGELAGVEVVPEAAPKESHEKSNGEAEATVKQVHGMVRTIREHVMFSIGGTEIPPKHPVMAWLVEHAGTVLTLYNRGPDGLVPWHRLKGKPWRISLPCWGEVVEFKLRTRHKLEARWKSGVFLGVRRLTTERIVGDAEGVYVVQSVRKVEERSRWNAELLLSVKGTPWKPMPGDGTSLEVELPQPISIAPELPHIIAAAPTAYVQERAPRRVYITKTDLDRWGYTAGCQACNDTRAGSRSPGTNHSQACRERLEAALRADPVQSARVTRAEERLDEAIALQGAAVDPNLAQGPDVPMAIPGPSPAQEGGASGSAGAIPASYATRKRAASKDLDDAERAARGAPEQDA